MMQEQTCGGQTDLYPSLRMQEDLKESVRKIKRKVKPKSFVIS